ncbi:MAG: hypothetical protein PVJ57_21150 [Phycisphaerae bacterium]|jgi:flagellar basal body-associated protein FliL
MAEEAAAPQAPPKRNPLIMTLIIVIGVALLEGVLFFVAIKMFGGGPSASYGVGDAHVTDGPAPAEETAFAEVELLKHFRVPNSKSGLMLIYDVDISVVVPESRREAVEELIKTKNAEISDRVAMTIRQASPRVLEEDDLSTLRMLLKQALGDLVGDEDAIERVLIPRFVPMRTD